MKAKSVMIVGACRVAFRVVPPPIRGLSHYSATRLAPASSLADSEKRRPPPPLPPPVTPVPPPTHLTWELRENEFTALTRTVRRAVLLPFKSQFYADTLVNHRTSSRRR